MVFGLIYGILIFVVNGLFIYMFDFGYFGSDVFFFVINDGLINL